jgi:two-component system response regulator FixJ
MSAGAEFKLIIVDDDEAVRDSLAMVLESRGYSVMAFASGPEFLSAHQPDWHGCAFVDVRMPGIDGLEVQQQLLSRGSQLAVVIMTAHGDVPIAVKAMKAGALDFLEKPVEPERLLDALRLAEESRQQMRPPSSAGADVASIRKRHAELTDREGEVLVRLVKGQSNKVIAYELDISPRTVELHRARVMQKMEARSLSNLVRMALAIGIDPT